MHSHNRQQDKGPGQPKKKLRTERLQRDFSGAAANVYRISNEQHVSRAVKTAHNGKVSELFLSCKIQACDFQLQA